MSKFSAIDVSSIDVPDTIEVPSFEDTLAEFKAFLVAKDPSYSEVLSLETDPLVILLELLAEEKVNWLARRNDDIRQHTLRNAFGSGLDNYAAFVGLVRDVITPADPVAVPPVEEVLEDDDRFRLRILDALEQFSTAGPEGAYVSHTFAAAPTIADVSVDAPKFGLAELDETIAAQLPAGAIVLMVEEDVALENPMPGDVAVTILSASGDGSASEDEIAAVVQTLGDDVVPLTDHPRVRSAEILTYQIEAVLTVLPNADLDQIAAQAELQCTDWTQGQRRLGVDIVISALSAALHLDGVYGVEIVEPSATIVVAEHQAAHCTGLTIRVGGVNV